MPKKQSQKNKSTMVRVGDLSKISGNVNIAGGNITTHQTTIGLSEDEIKRLFDSLYSAIDTRSNTPPTVKDDLNAEVKEIESAVTQAAQKKEKMDESFLSRRFRNIARMAPDILDVIVTALANPLAGMGVVVRKIAEKAKEEIR